MLTCNIVLRRKMVGANKMRFQSLLPAASPSEQVCVHRTQPLPPLHCLTSWVELTVRPRRAFNLN